MNELAIIPELIPDEKVIPAEWDYEKSIIKIKTVSNKWKHTTIEFIHELWVAHGVLTKRPGFEHIYNNEKNWTNVQKFTFFSYCEESGIERRTADRWVAFYDTLITTGDRHISQNVIEWYTPSDFISTVRDVMGEIDLDPASSKMAQEVCHPVVQA